MNATQYTLTFTSAQDYESPFDAGADNTYVVYVTISDGTNTGIYDTICDFHDGCRRDRRRRHDRLGRVCEHFIRERGRRRRGWNHRIGNRRRRQRRRHLQHDDRHLGLRRMVRHRRVRRHRPRRRHERARLRIGIDLHCNCNLNFGRRSTSTADFTITLTDFDEFDVSPPSDTDSDTNSVSENVTNGASAEITASASDSDGTNNEVTYGIASQTCTGAFTIAGSPGIVTVADTSAIDYETATNCYVVVRATSARLDGRHELLDIHHGRRRVRRWHSNRHRL